MKKTRIDAVDFRHGLTRIYTVFNSFLCDLCLPGVALAKRGGLKTLWLKLFWLLGSHNKEVIRQVEEIYNWLDEQLAAKFTCDACGKCCDFESYDHRLYVTTPEMLFFIDKVGTQTFKYSVERSNCHFDRSDAMRRGVEKSIKKDSSTSLRYARNDIEMAGGRCSYQANGKCTVYPHRFAGCRIFCCKGDADFQSELTETVLKKFKAICEKFQIPYRYEDLPTAIRNFSPPNNS
ncbi:MAG: hypothetical protein ABII09_02645 [Planctomycetota bacterium]